MIRRASPQFLKCSRRPSLGQFTNVGGQGTHRPEVTGAWRERIVFRQINRKAEPVLQALLGDYDQVAQAQRIQLTPVAEEHAGWRSLDLAVPRELLVEVRDGLVDNLQRFVEAAPAVS